MKTPGCKECEIMGFMCGSCHAAKYPANLSVQPTENTLSDMQVDTIPLASPEVRAERNRSARLGDIDYAD